MLLVGSGAAAGDDSEGDDPRDSTEELALGASRAAASGDCDTVKHLLRRIAGRNPRLHDALVRRRSIALCVADVVKPALATATE
jgi:hypothetical protein